MGELLLPGIEKYIEAHTSPPDEVLSSLDRHTHLHHLMPQMLSGTVQGTFLSLFCSAIQPRLILEIGTYTGYSTICMAQSMPESGKIITIDYNEEIEHTARQYFTRAGVEHKIDMRIGNAGDLVSNMSETNFDLVFIDADKSNYSAYYDLVFPKVRAGGWILADNVLWSGKVIAPNPDEDTQGIIDFNTKVQNDNRVKNVILSIRDGIMMAQKHN
ncbi:MAG TPA: O-methyltransferase [Chitinophagaceae bacterium]|nr:O-methyltransferase [Chitinophagaceae bacterium]